MVQRVSVSEAKATLIGLLGAVASGEEVEIIKRGHLVARIVPAGSAHGLRGRMSRIATSNAPDEELFRIGAGDAP